MASEPWPRPENVGILAAELYFPRTCVSQRELESFDGVSQGKYTIGLGQEAMAFCADNEDINSICLTVVRNLFEHYGVSPAEIGRLEVGTETIVDKSKSVKSVLMQLFGSNTEVEGVDTTNACYGGTNALFNAVNWVESSGWDGRKALVVAGDIAVYAEGAARPTGGAGAVAMLIGPNAPVVLEPFKGTHMEHAWDFYKPELHKEYPKVDGKLSVECYLRALDKCYERYGKRVAKDDRSLQVGDFFVFHSPYGKLVQKSFARLLYNDFLNHPDSPEFETVPAKLRTLPREATYGDREVEKVFMDLSKSLFASKVAPSTLCARNLGNLYTASVHGGLLSLLASAEAADLVGKRVVMFSYGSGLAASMFSWRVVSAPTDLCRALADIPKRLKERVWVEPKEFAGAMKLREDTHLLAPYEPSTSADALFPGTYYLKSIDDMYRRAYARAPMLKQTNGAA